MSRKLPETIVSDLDSFERLPLWKTCMGKPDALFLCRKGKVAVLIAHTRTKSKWLFKTATNPDWVEIPKAEIPRRYGNGSYIVYGLPDKLDFDLQYIKDQDRLYLYEETLSYSRQ